MATVRVEVELKEGFNEAPTGAFRFEALGREPLDPVDAMLMAEGEALVAVAVLPVQTTWRVRAGISAAWAADTTVQSGGSGSETVVSVPVWPAGMVSGRFVLADRRDTLPSTLALELSPARDAGSLRRALGQSSACPIRDDGQWQCRVPAGRFDVVVRPVGFVPLYRWDVDVARAHETKLGTYPIKRGASVKGTVETMTGLALPPRTRVRAELLAAPGGPSPGERHRKPAAEAFVDDRGFFQLAGVRQGTVRLLVEAEGLATARVFPLEILEGVEIALREPIVLELPLNVEVRVNPPTAPGGGAWLVRATRRSDYSASYNHSAAFDDTTNELGHLRVVDQEPGRYMIEVMDQHGQSWATLWDHPIEGVGEAVVDVLVEVVTVTGTVSVGEKPVTGEVFFGGRYGDQSVRLTSDEDGAFEGIIPREGIWRIEIESHDRTFRAKTRVEVTANRDGAAEVDIELPDTHVFGVVVDDAGQTVPHARVTISSRDGGDAADTDGDGGFSFRSHVGRIALVAKQAEQAAEPVLLELADGTELGPMTLRLNEMRSLSGTVVGANGATIAGALVQAAPVQPSRNVGDEARTDLDGTFTLSVPRSTTALEVVVAAPGHALEAFVVDARGPSLNLVVSQGGGRVTLRGDGEAGPYGLALAFQDNALLPFQTLVMWALGHGGSMSPDGKIVDIPNVAPGVYRYCLGVRTMVADLNAWQAASTCTAGTLNPGGTLELVLDADRAPSIAP